MNPPLSRRRFALATLLAGCGAARAQAGDYRLAFVGPASAQVVAIAPAMAAGLAAAFDAVNAEGGVHGRRLSLVHLDDGFVPERSVQVLAQAAQDPALLGVAAVFATLATLRIAASGLLGKTGLTVAAATTGARKARELRDPHLLFFRPSYQDEVAMIVRHAATLGMRRFAFFHEDSEFGQDGLQAMRAALSAQGGQQVASHAYPPSQADFTETARAFMQSDAQAVVLFAVQNVAARFVKALRRAGFRKPVFSISVVNADALAAELGAQDARGIGVVQVVPAPADPKFAVARQFQAVLARTGRAAYAGSQSALEGFIVGQLIATGMKRARGPLTREGFGAAMHALGSTELGGLRVALGAGGAPGPHYMELGVIDGAGKLRN